jgi:hypothetical protein
MKNKLPPKPFLCPQYILATKLFSISACFAKNKKKNHHNLLAELKFPFSAYEKKERKKKAKEKSNIYELIKILI